MNDLKLKRLVAKVDYKPLRAKILNTYIDEKNYLKTIEMCNELIEAIGESEEIDMLWFSYYTIGLSSLKLKNYSSCLENCKFMFKYIDNNNISIYNISMMLLANCYLGIGQNKKSISIYKQIVEYAKQYGSFSIRIVNIWNICRIKKDTSKMKKLIKILEKSEWDNNEWNRDYSKEQILQNMIIELNEIKNS